MKTIFPKKECHVPKWFVIDANGIIRMHHIGDINERVWSSKIGPLYRALVAEAKQNKEGGE